MKKDKSKIQKIFEKIKKRNKKKEPKQDIQAAFIIFAVNFEVFPIAINDDYNKDHHHNRHKNPLTCTEHIFLFLREIKLFGFKKLTNANLFFSNPKRYFCNDLALYNNNQ